MKKVLSRASFSTVFLTNYDALRKPSENKDTNRSLQLNLLGQNLDYEYTLCECTFFSFVNSKSYETMTTKAGGPKRPSSLDDEGPKEQSMVLRSLFWLL